MTDDDRNDLLIEINTNLKHLADHIRKIDSERSCKSNTHKIAFLQKLYIAGFSIIGFFGIIAGVAKLI